MDVKLKATQEDISLLSTAIRHMHGLSTFPIKYENKFQRHYLSNNIRNTRLTLLIGLLLFLGSTIFDLIFFLGTSSIVIRLFIISPLLFLIYLMSFNQYTEKFQQLFVVLFALIAMIGLVIIAGVIPAEMRNLLYASMVLVALFVSTVARLSFTYTLFVSFTLLLSFNVGYLLTPAAVNKYYFWSLLGNNYIFMAAAVLVSFASYVYEFNIRKQFLLNTLITKKNELATYLSHYDPLTGIANRRHFDQWFDETWQQAFRNNRAMGLLFIDFDYFKEYNDLYGHLMGDNTLIRVTDCLATTIKSKDLLARYGGDEFVVAIYNASLDKTIALTYEMMDKVNALKIKHDSSPITDHVTITIGFSIVLPRKEISMHKLIENADLALQFGKRHLRNQVYFYDRGQVDQLVQGKDYRVVHTVLLE